MIDGAICTDLLSFMKSVARKTQFAGCCIGLGSSILIVSHWYLDRVTPGIIPWGAVSSTQYRTQLNSSEILVRDDLFLRKLPVNVKRGKFTRPGVESAGVSNGRTPAA